MKSKSLLSWQINTNLAPNFTIYQGYGTTTELEQHLKGIDERLLLLEVPVFRWEQIALGYCAPERDEP